MAQLHWQVGGKNLKLLPTSFQRYESTQSAPPSPEFLSCIIYPPDESWEADYLVMWLLLPSFYIKDIANVAQGHSPLPVFCADLRTASGR